MKLETLRRFNVLRALPRQDNAELAVLIDGRPQEQASPCPGPEPEPDELWILKGRKPVLWTIPVWVRRGGAEVELRPAMDLLPRWVKAMTDLLEPLARDHQDGRWRLAPSKLAKNASRAHKNQQPEDCFSWALPQPKDPKPNMARDEFLDALYHKRVVGASRTEIGVWWLIFRNHSLDWLLNHEKPVDLGFIVLHPVLVRPDWKCRLLASLVQDEKANKIPVPRSTDKVLANPHFKKPRFFTWCGHGVDRFIEVEHKRTWFKLVRRVESVRLAVLKENYAKAVLESFHRSLKTLARVFSQWGSHIRKEPACIFPRGGSGSLVLYHYRESHNRATPIGRLAFLAARTFVGKKGMGYANYLYKKTQGLRKMSGVQRKNENLRQSTDNLVQPRNGTH